MVNEQKRLLTYKTEDGFEVNSLLITPEFPTEKELYENPIVINVHGVLGNFLARGTPQILPPALKEKRISTLSVNTRMAFLGQILGEGIFPDTIHEIRESVDSEPCQRIDEPEKGFIHTDWPSEIKQKTTST